MRCAKVRKGVMVAAVAALAGASPGLAQTPDPPARHTFGKAEFKAQGVKVERLTTPAQMTRDESAPSRGFTGPTSMAADPDNPRVVVAATADLRNRICYLVRSTDAGRTWHFSKSLPAPRTYPFCTNLSAGVPEASLAWGSGGTLYYALQAYGDGEGAREGRSSIVLARTTDLGESWQTTLVEDNRGKSGPEAPSASGVTGLAVDTSGSRDVVYVGFSRSYPGLPADAPPRKPELMVATSTDAGATFAPAVNLNDSSQVTQSIGGRDYKLVMRTSFGAPFLEAHDGVVLAVAGSQTPPDDQPPVPPEAGADLSPGTFYANPHPQLVARSTDRGRTWSIATLGPPIYAGTGSMTGLGRTRKGGAQGTWVAAYGATPATSPTTGLVDIVFQRSTDGGKTWSEPVAIDDDDPDRYFTSFYPQLDVAPNGRIDVVWQDNRDQTDYRHNVRYTYSNDGGDTWAPNVLVSDRPLDFNLGINFNSDLRQPPGVASTDQYAIFGWADTRHANELTQTQDNYGALAQFSPLPSTRSTALPVVGAAFAGLVVAGIVLLALHRARRREGPPPPPPRVEQREPVTVG